MNFEDRTCEAMKASIKVINNAMSLSKTKQCGQKDLMEPGKVEL